MSSWGSSGRRGGPWMEAGPSVEAAASIQLRGGGSASVVVVEVIGVRGEKGGVSDCRVFSLHRVLSLCEGAWGGHPSRYRSPAFRGSVWAGGINVEWLVISW